MYKGGRGGSGGPTQGLGRGGSAGPMTTQGGRGRGRAGHQPAAPRTRTPTRTPVVSAASGSGSVSSVNQLSEELQQLSVQAPAPQPQQQQQVVPASVYKFAQRPGYGTAGSRCVIKANHFLVELQDRDLHHYDVAIAPEVTSRCLNRAIMKELLAVNTTNFDGRRPAYDGRKGFYTAGSLPFTSKDFVVTLIDKDDRGSVRKERRFQVTIKLASKPDLYHLKEFLQRRRKDAPHETIQALDVVLREAAANIEGCNVVGRSFSAPGLGGKKEIGNGVECWKGFYQSLRPTQMGMSLNMDVSVTAFYEPIPAVEFAAKLLNLGDPLRTASRPLSDSDRVKLKKALRGVRVKVTHGEKYYKISGISSLPTNQLRFDAEDQKQKSVVQYFREKYNIRLRFASWPALQSGNDSRPIYLPMECCMIVEGQNYSKKMNERQVTALLKEACRPPTEREQSIQKIADFNDFDKHELASEFGICVKKELTRIDARVLPPPVLKYHDLGRDRTIRPRVGQWNMINAKLFHGARVHSWMCVNFSISLAEQMATRFFKELVGMCRNKGMDINPAPVFPMQSSHPNRLEKTLTDIHSMCTSERKQLQLLFIILPDVTGSYGTIKRVCETELGIVSQCCQPKQARRCNPQYLENVALKINVKAGGQNTVLEDALHRRIPLLSDIPTIIFGADVTHPQAGEDSSPSIAAIVASMNWPEVTTYRGLVSAQQHRQEIIEDCSTMIRELMIAFRRTTNQKPRRIIFYRDGVSEGQFSQVLSHEMDAIRKACASLEANYLPLVTFVVVQKRHHTRLFATNPTLTDRSGNILPGTVVDTTICHPSEHDFYLCSHAGIQGTSRPVHYQVLYDMNKFSADALQTLTNNLCYTYARCTRSVSVVPPAYYAHLAAFRARYYIEGGAASDNGNSAAGAGLRKGATQVRPLPAISPNVKDVMFYC